MQQNVETNYKFHQKMIDCGIKISFEVENLILIISLLLENLIETHQKYRLHIKKSMH